jgi:hypothetical protein
MAKPKKKPKFRRDGPSVWVKLLKILGVLLLIALILGGAYALTLLGPRKVNSDAANAPATGEIPKEVTALLNESHDLESQFHDNEKMRPVTPADLEILKKAISLQQEYLEKSNNRNGAAAQQRLDDMNALLQSEESVPLHQQSLDLEAQAHDLEDKNDYDGAKDLLAQAAKLEETIIHEMPLGKLAFSANARAVSLRLHIDYLTALPLSNESHAAEDAARAAIEKQDWPTAQTNFQHAYDLQLRLNREFADQRFSDPGRLLSLDDELTALHSLPEHQAIEKLIADGHAADASGDYLHAAELYQEAQRQQRDLIAKSKNSRFADPALIDTIEGFRQTSISRPLAAEIQAQTLAVAAQLRQRQTKAAAEALVVLALKVRNFRENFPRSTLVDDDLQLRLEYLNSKRNDLGAIQDEVYAQLIAVPGVKHFLFYKQEVPQSLYLAITGGNPSRNQGDNLPVESISWTEAEEFCRHLSWIISRPIRLPTVDEYKLALGQTDGLDVTTVSWNLDDSKGQTQPVATKAATGAGFYDLLGNVAEWVERTGDMDEDEAPVVGGNAQTPVDLIRSAPMSNLKITDRNRFTGFRFAVNSDDDAPLLPDLSGANSTPPTTPPSTSAAQPATSNAAPAATAPKSN